MSPAVISFSFFAIACRVYNIEALKSIAYSYKHIFSRFTSMLTESYAVTLASKYSSILRWHLSYLHVRCQFRVC
jgi:hypothetical protein